jgi:hypothetical protein
VPYRRLRLAVPSVRLELEVETLFDMEKPQ